jgi:adenylate cyclase
VDLVEVRFLPSGASVFVQPGTTVLEASRLCGVDIATGCERGQCGTDVVRIAGSIAPPGPAEQATLLRMDLPAACRLSCSARVCAGAVSVDLAVF